MTETIWGMDVGNTHTKIGVITDQKVVEIFRFRTEREKSIDEYYFQLKNIARELGSEKIPPLWIASVVPSVSIALERLQQARSLEMRWIQRDSDFSFQLQENIVHEIGADLLILAEAAVSIKGKNVIIVSAGTATTIFVVADGVLKGGAIAPGIKGSVESLFQDAAMLQTISLEPPSQFVGQNTTDALRSGILHGFAGMIDRIVEGIREELNQPDIPVVATGGMTGKVVQLSKTIHEVHQELGLTGIAQVAFRSKNKPTISVKVRK